MLQQLSPVFVPPISAPSQTSSIPVHTSTTQVKGGRCVFWPMCEEDSTSCGGSTKEGCRTYGKDGIKDTPSEEELQYQIRLKCWSKSKQEQKCYWYPFCENKCLDCGGIRKAECTKYGDDGSHKNERPPELELNKRKAEEKRKARKRARHSIRS